MIIGKISPRPYQLRTSLKAEAPRLRTYKYSFKDKTHLRYIVDVEEYPYNLYAMKFYVQKHAQSPLKFCKMTDRKCARSIIHTCIKIGIDIWEKNKLASFCFVGSPTLDEYVEKKYVDTKRFRAYARSARFLLSPDTFEHNEDKNKSSYFLINKKAKEVNPNILSDMIRMFNENYIMESIYPDLSNIIGNTLLRSAQSNDKRNNR